MTRKTLNFRNGHMRLTLTFLTAIGLTIAGTRTFAQTLYVSRVGDGTTTLAAAAAPIFLDQFNTTDITQTAAFSLNVTTAGTNPFTNSGNATTEGTLSLSIDSKYLVLGGYDAIVGSATVATSSTTTTTNGGPILREIAVVTLPTATNNISTATVDTSTTTTAFTGASIRSVATSGGSTPVLYAVGGVTGIVELAEGGSGAGTIVSTTSTNNRDINIINGNIYFSTGAGTHGIYTISGTPTTTGNTATNVVNTGAASSSYDFVFTDANTVYITDDRTSATTSGLGGLLQYTNSGSGFALANTYNLLNTAGTGTVGLRGLTYDGSGNFYAISTDSRLVSFNTSSSTFSTLATAPTNEAFRDVVFIPAAAPEPSSCVALFIGIGAVGLMIARRRIQIKNAA